MMYGVNTCSVIFTGILIFMTGQLDATINFAIQHPIFLVHLAGLCLPAVIGQWFIFRTIEHHGAAAFAMVMTSRQAFSLIASCVIFGHQFDWIAIVGFVVVIAVLLIKTRVSLVSKSVYQKIPQKDPEKGFGEEGFDIDLDDYDLESDHED
jgi:adenosine 3'-phospho 5'-phosphosulfate transporter B2